MIRILCADISGITEAEYQILYERASIQRRIRADRYRSKTDATRCLAADALLRFALGTGDYTEEKEPDGKPYLKEYPDFHYNLSHSGRWVVLAYGDSCLGVDVEEIRMDTDISAISSRFYSPEERHYVLEEPALSRSRFFEVWTGKESYIKFLGTGLKIDLRSFSVLHLPSQVYLYHQKLGEDFSLSLCTTHNDYAFQIMHLSRICK